MGILETSLNNKDTFYLPPRITVNFVLYISDSFPPIGTIEDPPNPIISGNV